MTRDQSKLFSNVYLEETVITWLCYGIQKNFWLKECLVW